MLTLVPAIAESPVSTERDDTIRLIRTELRRRSGKAWSVKGGRGSVWGWIYVTAPPARLDEFGSMVEADRIELAELLGLDTAHHQGVNIPASHDYRAEYIDRAKGNTPKIIAQPYWD
jgi:hypothetical protein